MNLDDGVPGLGWGGGTVLLIKVKVFILWMGGYLNYKQAIETIIMATIGATVGFFVHLFWKTVIKNKDDTTPNAVLKERKSGT